MLIFSMNFSPSKVFVVTVIPIWKGITKETLSYFTTTVCQSGSLIKVPLRKKIVPALVVSTAPVETMKSEIRSSRYQLKKISTVNSSLFLEPSFIQAAEKAGRFFVGATGGVIKSFVPKTILDAVARLPKPDESLKENALKSNGSSTIYSIQCEDDDRFTYYKSIVREEFSRKRSVYFCVPTLQDMKRAAATLPKGIEEYCYFFHGSLPKKEMVKAWSAVVESKHPVLVIGTGSILSIPRRDIGTIIIDRESAGAYKAMTRPYVDVRKFAEYFGKQTGADVIFGDLLLRIETLSRRDNGEVQERAPLSFRIISSAECKLIDVRRERDDKSEFKPLSDRVMEMLEDAGGHGERSFLYVTRRGLAPLTVCGDCGTVVVCDKCSAPIVLHAKIKDRFFLCHRCGDKRSAEERCKTCDSWKLTTLGIGSEQIENILEKKFPGRTIVRIDKEATPTLPRGIKAISAFYANPGAILIGTETALLYIDKKIENSAVVSIDSLFSIPDFRVNEKVMNILARIRSRSGKRFYVQTRYKELPIVNYAVQGNLSQFYRDEIAEREKFNYPPFSLLVKITYRGEKAEAWGEMERVAALLAPRPFTVFPAFIEVVKNKFVVNGLLRLKPGEWIDEDLLQLLRALPPSFTVKVDPENLL